MAQVTYRNENAAFPTTRRTDWGAIWAGVFTFAAIWTVFGSLGFAIFASSANAGAARPVFGMNVGIGIWIVVLTIIAMFVAGRETAHLAAIDNRHDGLIHGLIMFGLSVVAALVLSMVGSSALNGGATNVSTTTPYIFAVVADLGWIGFFSLFLGWLAALWGSSSALVLPRPQTNVRDIKTDVRTVA
jgi:hypothetical protein